MTTQTDGAIGYVEYAFAKQNKMAYAMLLNKAGKPVGPSAASFQAAAANADWAHSDSYYLILTDQDGGDQLADHGRELHTDVPGVAGSAAAGEALKFFAWP